MFFKKLIEPHPTAVLALATVFSASAPEPIAVASRQFARLAQLSAKLAKPLTSSWGPSMQISAATQDCVAFKLSIVSVWIIQGVMEAAAFFAAQRRIDDQGCHSCKIT